MPTRSLVAEMFIAMPTHLWVLLVAGVIAYYGLRTPAQGRPSLLHTRGVVYAALIALACLPNGLYAVLPPADTLADLRVRGLPAPNYLGRFYLDAFYTFAGWAGAWVVRSKFGRD